MSNNQTVIETLQKRRHEILKLLHEYEKELESLDYTIAKLSDEPILDKTKYDDENPDYIRGNEDGI